MTLAEHSKWGITPGRARFESPPQNLGRSSQRTSGKRTQDGWSVLRTRHIGAQRKPPKVAVSALFRSIDWCVFSTGSSRSNRAISVFLDRLLMLICMRTVRRRTNVLDALHVLHRDSVKSTLTTMSQGSFDLSEHRSISKGIFHTRRPEKIDTGGGVARTCSLS